MSRLAGKIAVVTGANSGIGLAIAKTLLDQGAARVYMTARRGKELEAAATSLGERAVPVVSDVNKLSDFDRVFERVKAESGRLDILVPNAGFAVPSPIGEITEDHYESLFDTNVKGVIWTVQKGLPLMSSGGSIVLIASIVASKGFAGWSMYSATKAAVRSFARTWSADLKGRNIRVNAVSPGVIRTPAYDKMGTSTEQRDGFLDFAASIAPLSRVGKDEEVAKVVAFLGSDESSFMTGSEVFVDGGIAQI